MGEKQQQRYVNPRGKKKKKVMCYVLRGLKPNMVPGLSPPGSVPASILVSGSGHGTLQRSSKKNGSCQLCLAVGRCSSSPGDQLWTQERQADTHA